jgi:predicted DsbA family dithiol-disulfide isomerase
MTGAEPKHIAIDIIADVACPWCYIGKRRLEQVLASFPGVAVHIRWRPYQLEQSVPPDGLDRKASLEKKYGADRVAAALNEIASAGRDVGLAFRFDKIQRTPNTLDAHRLVRLAKISGIQGKMIERLFKAYFCDGIDIGNRRNLIELGVETGLDRDTLEEVFSRRDDVPSVQEELATTRRLGITALPFFIFGDDVIVPGAQPKEMLAAALSKALDPVSRAS